MDIPFPIIKGNKALFIYHNFSNALSSFPFPASLKYTNVSPTFKKDEKTDQKKQTN